MIRMDFLIGMNTRQVLNTIMLMIARVPISDWLPTGNLMRPTAQLFMIHPVMMLTVPLLVLKMDGVPVVPEVPLDLTV